MASRPIPIRLEDELLARIDRVVAALSRRAHGVGITRSAVVRTAIDRGLKQLEAVLRQPPTRRRGPRAAERRGKAEDREP
jgi:hypothetical protein